MLQSSYTKKQIEEAVFLSKKVKEEKANNIYFTVPSMSGKTKYSVIWSDNKPLTAFSCTCQWGTYRDSNEEPVRKYCKHVLSVIFYLIEKERIPAYWKRAIYGS